MIPIPEKDQCICYKVPTMAYHYTDMIPNDELEEYLQAIFIGNAFDEDDFDGFHKEANAIFGKTIDAIKSGELRAEFIPNFNPDLIHPDWDGFEIGYDNMKWFMYMCTETINIFDVNGYVQICTSNDFRANLYNKRWYFTYVCDNPVDQCVFPILMDVDAETTSIDDIVKIMLDTLPKKHPDIGEFF